MLTSLLMLQALHGGPKTRTLSNGIRMPTKSACSHRSLRERQRARSSIATHATRARLRAPQDACSHGIPPLLVPRIIRHESFLLHVGFLSPPVSDRPSCVIKRALYTRAARSPPPPARGCEPHLDATGMQSSSAWIEDIHECMVSHDTHSHISPAYIRPSHFRIKTPIPIRWPSLNFGWCVHISEPNSGAKCSLCGSVKSFHSLGTASTPTLGVLTMSWNAMIRHALRSVLKSRDASL